MASPTAPGAAGKLTAAFSFYRGTFGSVLPEILRLYQTAQAGQTHPDFHFYDIVVSVVFSISAGIFTVAWQPENQFKAIRVGVSFPVLVSTMIQSAPSRP